jgi:hypothetical protein
VGHICFVKNLLKIQTEKLSPDTTIKTGRNPKSQMSREPKNTIMKIKRFIYSICSILMFSVLIISCSRISDDAKKFAGEWKFCLTNDNEQDPFWEKDKVLTFSLKENGEWVLGMDKGKGKWGKKAKNIGEVCDLDFGKWEVSSPHANQIENLTASIIEVEGIKVLDFKVDFSYTGWGTFDHSTEGVTLTPNKNYNADVHYYFVKTLDENLKVIKHFEEEPIKKEFEKLTEILEVNRMEDISLDGYSLMSTQRQADTTTKNKYIDILNYGIKAGKASEKHHKLLDLIIRSGEFCRTCRDRFSGVIYTINSEGVVDSITSSELESLPVSQRISLPLRQKIYCKECAISRSDLPEVLR